MCTHTPRNKRPQSKAWPINHYQVTLHIWTHRKAKGIFKKDADRNGSYKDTSTYQWQ